MVSLGIVGIELNGSFVFALSSRKVSVVKILNMGQRNVRFGKGLIDFQSLERGGLRFWQHLIWRHASSCLWHPQKSVTVGQTAVSQGEVRIFFYSLLKILEGLLHPLLASLVPVKTSL